MSQRKDIFAVSVAKDLQDRTTLQDILGRIQGKNRLPVSSVGKHLHSLLGNIQCDYNVLVCQILFSKTIPKVGLYF